MLWSSDDTMPLETGQVLEDKYRIVRLIGQGGMGAVYEGENTRIRRRVAIKVLHALAAENPELIARFEHEAQAAGQIGSDHILEVLDLGILPDGDRFLVMEYLDGEPLSERIQRRGRLTSAEALPLIAQVLSGLAAAHHVGIVHRDLKPENIFILKEKAGQPDFVKIIDFGISKFQSGGGEFRMTRTGVVLGTPYYMSPEQASGRPVDYRSDIYSVGVILYEALTGRTPFEAKSYNELILKIVLSTPEPLSALVPDAPPALCAIVETAMAREAEQRFQSAEEFAHALVAWSTRGQTVALGSRSGSSPGLAGLPIGSHASGAGWGQAPVPGLAAHPSGVGEQSGQPSFSASVPMGYPPPAGTPSGATPGRRTGSETVSGSLPGGAWSQTGTDALMRRTGHGRWIAVGAFVLLACAGGAFGISRFARTHAADTTPVTSAARQSDESSPTDSASSVARETPPTTATAVRNAAPPDAGTELAREGSALVTAAGGGAGAGAGSGTGAVAAGPSPATSRPMSPAPKAGSPAKKPPRPQPPKEAPQPPPVTPPPPINTGVGGLGY